MKYDKVYLRKKPQYDEMIDKIELKQPKMKYPNRVAQLMRNIPTYHNLMEIVHF